MRNVVNCHVVNRQTFVVSSTWEDEYDLDGSIQVVGYNTEFGLTRLQVRGVEPIVATVFLTADMCEELGVTMLYEARRLRGEIDGQ